MGRCVAIVALFGQELMNGMPFAFPLDLNFKIDLVSDATWQEHLMLIIYEGIMQ